MLYIKKRKYLSKSHFCYICFTEKYDFLKLHNCVKMSTTYNQVHNCVKKSTTYNQVHNCVKKSTTYNRVHNCVKKSTTCIAQTVLCTK